MILQSKLSLSWRARLWWNELPAAQFTPTGLATRSFEAVPGVAASRSAAIEVVIHTGPQILYGVLGGEFNPESMRELKLAVLTGDSKGPPFVGALGAHNDDIRIGLPSEYADAVLAGALESLERREAIPAGELTLNRAAHGLVGSSSVLFRRLARAVCRLLAFQVDVPSDSDLQLLLEAGFR